MGKSIFKQKVLKSKWGIVCSFNSSYMHVKNIGTECVKEKEIITLNIEIPLCTGDKFYIEELEKTVFIDEKLRTSKGNVVYYIEPEHIDDERSRIQHKELVNRELEEKYDDLQNRYNKIKDELDEKDTLLNLPWWKRLLNLA